MPKRIDPALKARALRLVSEHQQEYPSQTAAIMAVARQVGVGSESLRRWVVQAQIDAGARARGEQRGERGDQAVEGGEPPAA